MKSAQFDFVFAAPSSAVPLSQGTAATPPRHPRRRETRGLTKEKNNSSLLITSPPQTKINELSQRFSDAVGVSSGSNAGDDRDTSTNDALTPSRPHWDALRSRRRGPKPWNDNAEAGSGEADSLYIANVHGAHGLDTAPKPVPRTLTGVLGDSHPIPLELVAYNSDVLEHIFLWLSRGSLSALMATCHYFSEAALPALCKRLREPIYFSWNLLSFYAFLRAKSHSPRWTMIQDLHLNVRACANVPSPDLWHYFLGYAAENDISSIMYHTLHLCRNLRRLHLVHCFDDAQDLQPAVRAISAMPSLEELGIQGISSIRVQQIQQIVRKKPHLRALTIYGVLIDLCIPEILDYLHMASATLVELDLSSTFEWITLAHVIFPLVRKLFIGPPKDWDFRKMATIFPGLLHLKIAAHRTRRGGLHDTEGNMQGELEDLRKLHRQHWRDHPDQRPSLESLQAAMNPCALYALAVPRISRLSLSYAHPDLTRFEPFVDMCRVILSEAAPSWVELRLLSALRPYLSDVESNLASRRSLLGELDACKASLRRCTVTIGNAPQASGRFSDTYLCVLNSLQYGIRRDGAPLSHLFVTHVPGSIRATRNAYQDLREKALETTRALVKSCDTLTWVGFYFPSEVLCSWEVKRGSAPPACQDETERAIELKELDTEQGWAVVYRERMLGDM